MDDQIWSLIKSGMALKHRTMFLIVGEKGKDQVASLHHMLSKAVVGARPTVLWCYEKKLGFSSHRKKRIKRGKLGMNEDNLFEMFVDDATDIRYCYYSETNQIVGETYGMCVLQDFETLTPSVMAQTIETVEGGGVVAILLQREEDIVGAFNQKIMSSLPSCKTCVVVDHNWNLHPSFTSHCPRVDAVSTKTKENKLTPRELELEELKIKWQDTQPVGALVNLCKTCDQANAILEFIDALSKRSVRRKVTLSGARGCGKSAALGMAISAAISFSYSNVFVTSASFKDAKTLFEFVVKGLDAIGYKKRVHYDVIHSSDPESIRVVVSRDHQQTIQYIDPSAAGKLGLAELVVIDEAAATPLVHVKELLGPYHVFMASTTSGYEATGRFSFLKFNHQLRQHAGTSGGVTEEITSGSDGVDSALDGRLREVELNEPIRYAAGDDVERWLNEVLCMDPLAAASASSSYPAPQECNLYYINRDTLFCGRGKAKAFLQQLVALYGADQLKNSPNDVKTMCDAPAHHLFCLISPVDPRINVIPEILCLIQVCLEGNISNVTMTDLLSEDQLPSTELIPRTVAREFLDPEFMSLSGLRIVRIATRHQHMGYGTRALQLLQEYYDGRVACMEEVDANVPPLLLNLSQRRAEVVNYIGVSFGLTGERLRFWKKSGFVPVYLRHTLNYLSDEPSCIMLKALQDDEQNKNATWLSQLWHDFRRRLVRLLKLKSFSFHPAIALDLLHDEQLHENASTMTGKALEIEMTKYDVKQLVQAYSGDKADYHRVIDLLKKLGQLYFLRRLGDVTFNTYEVRILIGLSVQNKTLDDISQDVNLPKPQVLCLFNNMVRQMIKHLNGICEAEVAKTVVEHEDVSMEPLKESLDEELGKAAEDYEKIQKEKKMLEDKSHKSLKRGPTGVVLTKRSSSLKRQLGKHSKPNSYSRENKKKRKFKTGN